ncbi:hypothetical protein OH492_15275 [Vibrio chagasii]|nr:hypothetical protein [Vibrio chagasii]
MLDANEAWTGLNLEELFKSAGWKFDIAMIDSLCRNSDARWHIKHPILCADESCHTTSQLSKSLLGWKCEMVNIKLDKTGGLTEALALAEEEAQDLFTLMSLYGVALHWQCVQRAAKSLCNLKLSTSTALYYLVKTCRQH